MQDRLSGLVPEVRDILTHLAVRDDNLGTAVNTLQKRLDRYGLANFTLAIGLAILANSPHPNSIRVLCERIRHQRGQSDAPQTPLVTDPRLRAIQARPHSLTTFDRLGAAQPTNSRTCGLNWCPRATACARRC